MHGRILAQNTLYLTAASVGQKILAFGYFISLARIMQPEATGQYFLALSLTTVFAVIADFGVTPVVIREVAKQPSNTQPVVGAFVSTRALGYPPSFQFLIVFAVFVMLADAISLMFYGALRGLHTLRYESLGVFAGQFITVSIGCLVLFFHPSLPWLMVAILAGSIFNMIFSAFRVVKHAGLITLLPQWEGKSVRALLKTALPFALAAIFVKVYSYTDTIMLSKFMGDAAVGLYSIAYKFTYAFQFIPMAFIAALYPTLSTLLAEKNEQALARTFDHAMWYSAIIAAPVVFGIWAIAPEVVRLAGEDYGHAAPVLAVLIFGLLPIFLDFPIGSLLNAANRQSTKTALMGATMIINVSLNFWLIPERGLMGASIAAVVSFVFLFLSGLWFIPQIIPSYRFQTLLRTVIPIIFSGAIMGAFTIMGKKILPLPLTVIASALLYVALLFACGSLKREHLAIALSLLKHKSAYAS